jgi:aspartate aminotransferase/aminotransferase
MTGWRVGYAACHEVLAPLVEKMLMIQQYTFVCAPAPFQQSLLTALDYDMSGYVADYRQKRDRILEGSYATSDEKIEQGIEILNKLA